MARRRMIDPDIWFNDKFTMLPDAARLFFIGIFSNADDDGRLKASPKYLKAHIFPYDETKTIENIKSWRDQCAEQKLIIIYSVNGQECLVLPGWKEHQQIRKDTYHPSEIPAPDGQLPLKHQTTTPSLQDRNESVTTDVTPTLHNKSSLVKSSQVKSNQSSIINFDVLSNEKDLTDFLTDFLTENLSAEGGRAKVMHFLKNELWPKSNRTMDSGVYDVLFESLRRYPVPKLARGIAKTLKYADGKKKPANYVLKILEEKEAD